MSSSVVQILIADDDRMTREMLVSYLGDHDMSAVAVSSNEDILRRIASRQPSLVIVDPWSGQDQGLDLLREIRTHSDIPVIVTTGHRCDEVDRVIALELGADDYVIKPFGFRELLARIRAMLRRRPPGSRAPEPGPEQSRCRFGSWHLDRRMRRLTGPDGKPVVLTKGEYALLMAFLDAPLRPLTREHLLQATRIHGDIFDRSIDVQVLRLRRKLATNPTTPQVIATEHGVGYLFALPVEPYKPEPHAAPAAPIDHVPDLAEAQVKLRDRRAGTAFPQFVRPGTPHRTRHR